MSESEDEKTMEVDNDETVDSDDDDEAIKVDEAKKAEMPGRSMVMELKLRDDLHPYKHGEIVWVKMGPCFWPGEVKDYDTLPDDIQNSRQKVPLVTVKFFNEDSYEFVKTLDKIYTYNCTKKDEFIRKGLNLYRARNRLMDKFPSDVIVAERMIGGDENIVDDPKFAPEEKPRILKVPRSKKKGKGKGRARSSAATPNSRIIPVEYRNVTHRRFIGDRSDFQIILMEQKSVEPSKPEKTFSCFTCGFNTTSVEVIAMHHLIGRHRRVTPALKSKRKSTASVSKKPRGKSRKLTYDDLAVSDSSDKNRSASDSDDSEEDGRKSTTEKSVGRNKKKTLKMKTPAINAISAKLSDTFSSPTRLQILNDWADDCCPINESTDEETRPNDKLADTNKVEDSNDGKVEGPSNKDPRNTISESAINDKLKITTVIDDDNNKGKDLVSSNNEVINRTEAVFSYERMDVTDPIQDSKIKAAGIEMLINKIKASRERTGSFTKSEIVDNGTKIEIIRNEDDGINKDKEMEKTIADPLCESGASNKDNKLEANNIDINKIHETKIVDKELEMITNIVENKEDIVSKLDAVLNLSLAHKYKQGCENSKVQGGKDEQGPEITKDKLVDYFGFNEEDEDDIILNDDKLPEIIADQSEKSNSSSIEDFKKILESTTVPKLPEIPDSLKCEQNFHKANTVKFPDKTSDEKLENHTKDNEKNEVATKLTNPKKRFAKSFEDFEQSLKIERERVESCKKTESEEIDSNVEDDDLSFSSDSLSIRDVFEKTKHKIIKSFEDFEKTLIVKNKQGKVDKQATGEKEEVGSIFNLSEIKNKNLEVSSATVEIECSKNEGKKISDKEIIKHNDSKETFVSNNEETPVVKILANQIIRSGKTNKIDVPIKDTPDKSIGNIEEITTKLKTDKKVENITPKSESVKKLVEINLFDKEDKSKLKNKLDEKKKDPKQNIRKSFVFKDVDSGSPILGGKMKFLKRKVDSNRFKPDDIKLKPITEAEKLKVGKEDKLRRDQEDKLNLKRKDEDKSYKDEVKLNKEELTKDKILIKKLDEVIFKISKDETKRTYLNTNKEPDRSIIVLDKIELKTKEDDKNKLKLSKDAEVSKLEDNSMTQSINEENDLFTDYKVISRGGKEFILQLTDESKVLSKDEAESKLKLGKVGNLAEEKNVTSVLKSDYVQELSPVLNNRRKWAEKSLSLEKRKSFKKKIIPKLPTSPAINMRPKKPYLALQDKSVFKKDPKKLILKVSKLKNQLMNKLNDPERKTYSAKPSTSTLVVDETKKKEVIKTYPIKLTSQELINDVVEVTINKEKTHKTEQLVLNSSCIVEDMEIETDLKETVLQETPQVVKITTPEFNDDSALNTLATVSEMSGLDLVQGEKEKNIDKNIRVVTESDLTDKQVEIAKVPILEQGTVKSTTIASFSVDFTGDLYAPDVKLDLKNIDKPIKSKLKPAHSLITDLKVTESNKSNKGSDINSVEMEMAKLTHTSMEQEETAQPQEATTSKKLLEILSENKPQLELINKVKSQMHEELITDLDPAIKIKKMEVSITTQEVKQRSNDTHPQKTLAIEESLVKKLKQVKTEIRPIGKETNILRNKIPVKLKTYESLSRLKQADAQTLKPTTSSLVLKTLDSSEKPRFKLNKCYPSVTKAESGEVPIRNKLLTSVTGTNQLLNDKVGIINDDLEVSVKKVHEEIDTFIIQKHQKRAISEKLPESPPTKILKKTLTKPLQTSYSVIKTTNKGEDNIFDIDSMPIVLDNQILTTENIETIPIVMQDGKNSKIQLKKNSPPPMKLLNKPGSSLLKDSQLKTSPTQKTYMKSVKRVINSTSSTETSLGILSPANKYVIMSSDLNKPVKREVKKTNLLGPGSSNKLQNIVQEPTGNKIMIVTNNQGQQSRVLLTPAQQKMMGYQTIKSTVKSPVVQKDAPKITHLKSPSLMKPKPTVSAITTSSNLSTIKKINKFESKNKLIGQNVILNSQVQSKGQSKTILIKNSQGQTVKKLQGTDDALLEQQVAEQIEAINRATNAKTQIQYKSPQKREVIKKAEPPKVQSKTQLIYNPASCSKINVPPLVPITPVKKLESKQIVQKPTKIVNTPIFHRGEVNQGNQTAIAEGQILALPLDGQPQSYMLVKLDETGNFTPLNNEALLSLDPNLNLGGDLGNVVVQIDQNETIKVATSTKQEIIETASPKLIEVPKADNSSKLIEEPPEAMLDNSDPIQAIACTINNGETNQQLIITGDPVSTQKFIDSLNEANSDLTNILSSAEGNILIHIDGQQILINTDTDNQTLMTLNPELAAEISNENTGNPIFASNTQSQDILAAALADTDVFQQDQTMVPSNSLVASQLSPGNSLYPINVNSVLETSAMHSPIMTPLEVPSTNIKKIADEMDILSQIPKNVDLPITVTDPNITQTVAQQQAAILASELHSNLELPITLQDVSVTATNIPIPFGYTLPLDVSVDIQKPFRTSISMPLLTEEPDDSHVPVGDNVSLIDDTISVVNTSENVSVDENMSVDELISVDGSISVDEIISINESSSTDENTCVDVNSPDNEEDSVPDEHASGVEKDLIATVPNEIIEKTSEMNDTNKDIIMESTVKSPVEINNEVEISYPQKLKDEYLLSSISSINNQMSSSLSEPPPDMFDFSLETSFELREASKGLTDEAVDFSVHDVNNSEKILETESEKSGSGSRLATPDTHSPSTNSTDDSCEIPLQPEIFTEITNKSSEQSDACPKVLDDRKEC